MNKDEIKKKLDEDKKRREDLVLQMWDNLKEFKDPYDVPTLPHADEKTWREFYVPRLIKAGGIPKRKLENGATYIGRHRNCTEATWNQEKDVFIYKRNKFGHVFDDETNHFEDDNKFALFVPIRKKA